jgi:ferritin
MEEFSAFKKNKMNRLNEAIDFGTTPNKPKSLSPDVEKMINERLGDEYTAYFFYRNAANWCKNANYKKAAAFFDAEAQGELGHAQGLQDYLTQWNLIPVIPQVPTALNFGGLVEIINKAYEIEYNLLQKYSADQQALLGKDPATFNFIQKYVDIQNGEVEEYSDYLNALELVNPSNKFEVLYFEQTYF